MIFFSDFDGTLTLEDKKLTREFFEIIDFVNERNHELVVVSGRSLSWGHFLLTHFPLKACIMEGGGVILYLDEKKNIVQELLISDLELEKLASFTTNLKHHFPRIPLSADSYGRLTDRAIEFHLMEEEWIKEVIDYMGKHQINHSKSNVHINFWAGEISKYLGVQKFLTQFRPGLKRDESWFFGDAPNDQSMFEHFHNCIGVSNIEHCLDRLSHRPRIILEGDENVGPKGVLNSIRKLG